MATLRLTPRQMGGAIDAVGELDPSTFAYGSVSYTVQRLWVSTADEHSGNPNQPRPAQRREPEAAPAHLQNVWHRGPAPLGEPHDFNLNASSAHATATGRYEWDVSSVHDLCE